MVGFWDVTKGYIDIENISVLILNGEYVGNTEEHWDEGLGGYVLYKIFDINGVKYICTRQGWVFRNP